MAKNKKQKVETQKILKDKISKTGSTVFVKFSALPVNDSNSMRRSLRQEGIGYTVAKKTLLKRALSEAGVSGEVPSLEGEVAIAYGEDAILPAKSISIYAKKYDGKLTILGGILENKYLAAAEVIALSKIPGREVLYGKLVNVLNSPIQGFVSTLNGVTKNLVVVLDQIAKSKSN